MKIKISSLPFYRIWLFWVCLFCLYFSGFLGIDKVSAQEIQYTLILESEQIQSQEKQVFIEMKNNINNFLNNRRWTTDKYNSTEKIKATIAIRLTEMPSIGVYKGNIQIQSSRPVYGAGYESVLINFFDKDVDFDYVQNQPMDYNDNTYTSNLTSLLAFYSYMILAYDYDSFSKMGGGPYVDKAQQVVNVSQQSGMPGWKAFDGNPNSRYWWCENLNNPQFIGFREQSYQYYRMGLDQMMNNPEQARAKVLDMLQALKKIHEVKPNSALLRTYFNTKAEELVNILSESSSADKNKAFDFLKDMDPTNMEKYEKGLK